MITINREKLLTEGIEVVPVPDLSLISTKASFYEVLAGDSARDAIVQARIGKINLTLNMHGEILHSAALWLSQPEDIGASWEHAEANEARREARHIELVTRLFGQPNGTVGRYVVESFMDVTTALHVILITKGSGADRLQ